MLRTWWGILENFLSGLPRLVLLALAVFLLREPHVQGPLADLGWYFRWPLELLLVVLGAMTLAAFLRLVLRHGEDDTGQGAGTPDVPKVPPAAPVQGESLHA
jgi:hypothetical protein